MLREAPKFAELAEWFPRAMGVAVRSIIVTEAERISDSCGYGVPLMTFAGHRPNMDQWADRKGSDGIRAHWADKDAASLDGLPGVVPAP